MDRAAKKQFIFQFMLKLIACAGYTSQERKYLVKVSN